MITSDRKTKIILTLDVEDADRFQEFIGSVQEMGITWRNGAELEAEDSDMIDDFGRALKEVLGK